MKLITWNIKVGQNADGSYPANKKSNLKRIAMTILNRGADIALLQEVDNGTVRSGRLNQAEYIQEYLKKAAGVNWEMVYEPTVYYKTGSFGICILSKCPVLDKQCCKFEYTGIEDRACVIVRIEENNKNIVIGTTHLTDENNRDLEEAPHQRYEAKCIKEKLAGYYNNPIIIGGDFNNTINSVTYQCMLENTFEMKDAGPFTGNSLVRADKKVDFIFYRYLSLAESQILDIAISDHKPLLFEFEL